MANIHIKELFGSDNITALTEKVNFNFDQLILAGGGPQGPIGESGASGPVGPGGVRGSQWIGASGSAGVTTPTDGVFRENDFKLNPNGDVDYYVGTAFVTTGINLQGPKGDTGGSGDGAISIIPGLAQSGRFFPIVNTADGTPTMGQYFQTIPASDKDDAKATGTSWYSVGADFTLIGRGNNSLVLGRYATLFNTGLSGAGNEPPTDSSGNINAVMKNFPLQEADVPMLFISQNEWLNPNGYRNNVFKNGISLGLTKSQPDSGYDSTSPASGNDMDYEDNANISIENSYHDLKISSSKLLTLSGGAKAGDDGTSSFRLGNTYGSQRRSAFQSTIDNYSTKLLSPIYTNFKIQDSFFVDLSDTSSSDTTGKEFITNAQTTFFQNSKFYESDVGTDSKPNDYRKSIAKTFISTINDPNYGDKDTPNSDVGANELVFFNADMLYENTKSKTITKTIDPAILTKYKSDGSISSQTTHEHRTIFDSANRSYQFRIGQTTVNPGRMNHQVKRTASPADGNDWVPGGTTGIPTLRNGIKINLTYQGQGYDQCFIQYSGIDNENYYAEGMGNSGGYDNYPFYGVTPNDRGLDQALGYDIRDAMGSEKFKGSRSIARMGIYPGFFRREKDTSGIFIGDEDARQKKFFDVAHRMLPTGSLDVFGTVRIREQETTDAGAKDGWVAVNKKDGILGFVEPSAVNSVPTYSIMMFPEMASNKFSFYTSSSRSFGATTGQKAFGYINKTNGAAFAAFPGKGSDELKDYYMCNGAVLADARDILVTGPFSKMKGMNIDADNGKEFVENGVRISGNNYPQGDIGFDYVVNTDFEGMGGETVYDSNLKNTSGTYIADYMCNWFNGVTQPNSSYAMNRMFDGTRTAGWGYSILAGRKIESGFRVVLPNYFGKVAKMQFPDSNFIVRAISGQSLIYPDSAVYEKNDSGYIYHGTNTKYNSQWMMKGMFDNGGFPYILGNQMPKMQLPSHSHESGTLNITNGDEVPTQERSSQFGAHKHDFDRTVSGSTTPIESISGPGTAGKNQGQNQLTNAYGQISVSMDNSAHMHGSEAFAGDTAQTGNFKPFYASGGGQVASTYDINHYRITGTGTTSDTFKLYKTFGYDATSSDSNYSKFSNWIYYVPGVDDTSSTNWNPDSSGQKFFSPPFKGTIMAINLAGIKNPNRNNTTIKDLHYVAGVPMCGVHAVSTGTGKFLPKGDMSWWSWADIGVKVQANRFSARGSSDPDGGENWSPMDSSKYMDLLAYYPGGWNTVNVYMGRTNSYAFEYGFKSMSRNDDTMHPETYIDTDTGTRYWPNNESGRQFYDVSQLDYNTYPTSDSSYPASQKWAVNQKYRYNLYKTNTGKMNYFDL